MPPPRQRSLLSHLLSRWDQTIADAPAAYEAWRTGDSDALDAFINAPLRDSDADLYALIIADRQAALADRVASLLESPEIAFIALPAGFVIGAGAIPDRLEAAGFTVERVVVPALRDN